MFAHFDLAIIVALTGLSATNAAPSPQGTVAIAGTAGAAAPVVAAAWAAEGAALATAGTVAANVGAFTGTVLPAGTAALTALSAGAGLGGAATVGAATVAPSIIALSSLGPPGWFFGGICMTASIIGDNGVDMKCWKQVINDKDLSSEELTHFEQNGMPFTILKEKCEIIYDGRFVYVREKDGNGDKFILTVSDPEGHPFLLHVTPFVPQKMITNE